MLNKPTASRQIVDVAVVVPLHNRAQIVLATLNSIASQTDLPRKLIVVDDGSTDGSVQSVARWMAAHDYLPIDFILQCERHGGASATRNKGMELADDCQYIAFLDSDDCWPADFLQRACEAFAMQPEAVGATADRQFIHFDGMPNALQSTQYLAVNATQWLIEHDGGIVSCSLFPTKHIRELGGFDVDVPSGHDSKLFLPLSLRGPWLHLPGAPVQLAQGNGDLVGEADNLSRSVDNQALIWAEIHEQFLLEQGGAKYVSARAVRNCLWSRGYGAAREAHKAGRLELAIICYRRALRWNRFSLRTQFHYWQASLARRATPTSQKQESMPLKAVA